MLHLLKRYNLDVACDVICCVQVNQILCCLTWRPEWAEDIVTLAHERRDNFPCAIVGIDIAAGEEHFDKVSVSTLFLKRGIGLLLAKT